LYFNIIKYCYDITRREYGKLYSNHLTIHCGYYI